MHIVYMYVYEVHIYCAVTAVTNTIRDSGAVWQGAVLTGHSLNRMRNHNLFIHCVV